MAAPTGSPQPCRSARLGPGPAMQRQEKIGQDHAGDHQHDVE
jgi:hypothetical protein